MLAKVLSLSLPFLIFLIAVVGCGSGNRSSYPPSSSPSTSSDLESTASKSKSSNGFSTVARIKIGYLSIGLDVDVQGKIKFDYKISKSFTIGAGPFSLELGVKQALESAEENPDKHRLIIIVEDSSGEVNRLEYDIGEEFRVSFHKPERVDIIGKHNSTIIVIKNPQTKDSNKKEIGTYIVDTQDDSGLHIRRNKNAQSESITRIPENERVIVLSSGNNRKNQWLRVRYDGYEGWANGKYLYREDSQNRSSSYNNKATNADESYRYFVDTRDDSGLYLKEEKDLESDHTTYVNENTEVKFIYWDDEYVIVNGREGRWCKVEHNGTEGWAWGWYLRKEHR